MVYRLACGLTLVALTACASGEEQNLPTSGFSGAYPATMPATASVSASASASAGMSSTSDPTDGTDSSAATTDLVRPDLPQDTSTGGPELTTGPVDTTGPDGTSDPGTSSTSTTTGPVIVCGDGTIEGGEECEAGNLNGQSCEGLGFSGGTLACDPTCLFDKTQCFSISCGDGELNGDEECDCGQQGSPCSDAQLGNAACSQFAAPQNGNYHGGTLACGSPQSCTYNKSGCIYCGDGVRNGPEACEGGDLGGQTCQGLGFTGGNLSCNANCTHNTGGCFNAFCGDGTCNNGENSCSCAQDCPDDPNSCSPCDCGTFNANWPCQCDDLCVDFGDCCPNYSC